MSDSLWPQGLQHTRAPRVCSNSCPLESTKWKEMNLEFLPFQTRSWLLKRQTLKKCSIFHQSLLIYHKYFNYSQEQMGKQIQPSSLYDGLKIEKWQLLFVRLASWRSFFKGTACNWEKKKFFYFVVSVYTLKRLIEFHCL